MFRYLVPGSNGQLIFDSGFEKYSDEIIQKFLVHQAATSNHMDVDFLQSLGDNAIHLSSAKVKVINVENPCMEPSGRVWGIRLLRLRPIKLFFTGDPAQRKSIVLPSKDQQEMYFHSVNKYLLSARGSILNNASREESIKSLSSSCPQFNDPDSSMEWSIPKTTGRYLEIP